MILLKKTRLLKSAIRHNMKKRLWLIVLFMICITALFVVKTYALFETNGHGKQDLTIGRWLININSTDVTFSESVGLDIFQYDEDAHVREGYIAPGNGGRFLIDLDATDTDVTMKCTIEMNSSELSNHPNMDVNIQSSTKTNLLNSDKNYMVIINHTDVDRSTQVWYQLDWENNDAYDEEDTKLIGEEIHINFSIHCEQYLGE